MFCSAKKSSGSTGSRSKHLDTFRNKVSIVTGGAGFIGSNLCRMLVNTCAHKVVVIDNFSSGSAKNLDFPHSLFTLDIEEIDPDQFCASLQKEGYSSVDFIWNFASVPSPQHFVKDAERALSCIDVNVNGTQKMLALARIYDAVFIQASTSEVYGNPRYEDLPLCEEEKMARVDTIGPRSVYDESKRMAESLCGYYARFHSTRCGIARIFNTYGPGCGDDGRVMFEFCKSVLNGNMLRVYGDGTQTRSFCYVDDTVLGLVKLAQYAAAGGIEDKKPVVVNIGSDNEIQIGDLAHAVLRECAGVKMHAWRQNRIAYIYEEARILDDPIRRRPSIHKAHNLLNWRPRVPLSEGIQKTFEYISRCSSQVIRFS
jgi:nucleoside-diphosphate-sugar epimerase